MFSVISGQTSLYMTLPENNTGKKVGNLKDSPGSTPQQLVKHQIENFDYHVTDEEMGNMKISTKLSEKQKSEANEEADELEKDNVGTSYDVIDE